MKYFDIDSSFLDAHPEVQNLPAWKTYMSKGGKREKVNKVFWMVWLYVSPDSPLGNFSDKERIRKAALLTGGAEEFYTRKKKSVDAMIHEYRTQIAGPAERAYSHAVEAFDMYVKNRPGEDEVESLPKYVTEMDKMAKTIASLKQELNKERKEGATYGNVEETLSDKGQI